MSGLPSDTAATASRTSGSRTRRGRGGGADRAVHFAFQAADTDEVQAFYDAALELGAESLHEPRLWPEYHPGYFGAFVRDPGRQQRRGGVPRSGAGQLSSDGPLA